MKGKERKHSLLEHKRKTVRKNFTFELHKSVQMTVVNILHYIIGDITAKDKSNFSFFPKRKMTSYSGKANERKWNFFLTN